MHANPMHLSFVAKVRSPQAECAIRLALTLKDSQRWRDINHAESFIPHDIM